MAYYRARYCLAVVPVVIVAGALQLLLAWVFIWTPTSGLRGWIMCWSADLDHWMQDWCYRQWRSLYEREHLFEILGREPPG